MPRLQRASAFVEYGLLIACISVVVLIGAYSFGHAVYDWFRDLVFVITTH